MISHVAFTIFATLMLVLSVLGAPTPIANAAATVQLEERTTHTGRVSFFFDLFIYMAVYSRCLLSVTGNVVQRWCVHDLDVVGCALS